MKILTVRRADRFAGAAFAIAVQAGLLVLLLSSRTLLVPVAPVVRELTLILPHLKNVPPPPARASQQPAPSFHAPLPIVPLPPNPTAPAATPPDVSKLGQSIFDCAPENYASLTPDQRAHCSRPSDGVAIQQAPGLMGTRSYVKDGKHWADELEKRNAPIDSCMRIETQKLGVGQEQQVLMADPACVAEKLQKTFDK